MPRITLRIETIEFHDCGPDTLLAVTVRATANGHAFSPSTFSPAIELPTQHTNLRVTVTAAEGASIEVAAEFGALPSVAFTIAVPETVTELVFESARVNLLVTATRAGAERETPADVPRSADGESGATVVIESEPPEVRVEFVSPAGPPVRGTLACPTEGNVARSLRMGLWDNAWNHDGEPPPPSPRPATYSDPSGVFRNGADDADHFIGLDPRRFYLRVVHPDSTATAVTVDLKTYWNHAGSSLCDGGGTSPGITCTRVPGSAGVFVSRAIMLVSSEYDLAVPDGVHSGDVPNAGLKQRGQTDFRLRLAGMFGSVEARYTSNSSAGTVTATAELFRGERRHLRLYLFEVDRALDEDLGFRVPYHGGEAVCTVRDEVFLRDLRVARYVYARLGIHITTMQYPGATVVEHVSGGTTDYLNQIDMPLPPGRSWTTAGRNRMEVAVANATPSVGAGIRAFYVMSFDSYSEPSDGTRSNRGESWTPWFVENRRPPLEDSDALRNCMFFNTPTRGAYTLAHEINHILVNSPGLQPEDQHYFGTDVRHNLLSNGNLESYETFESHSRIREDSVTRILSRLNEVR